MRAQVLALQVVLPSGKVITTGSRAPKTSAGYDLTGLFVGSEGTLGVITELTVRLYGIPEHAVALRIVFPTLGAACSAGAAAAAGLAATRLELLDEPAVIAANDHFGTSYPPGPCLLVEFAGSTESVRSDLELMHQIAEENEASELCHALSEEDRVRLWEVRHGQAEAVRAAWTGMGVRSTDVCVPISELPGAVEVASTEIAQLELTATIVGHVGDGNFHVAVAIDPTDPAAHSNFERFSDRLVEDALTRGGTCSGEHGIGLGKIAALEREHGDQIAYMRGIKRLFDPNNIMNPGKIVA
jgi:D-lactate dehydrogenase (cytochrome)